VVSPNTTKQKPTSSPWSTSSRQLQPLSARCRFWLDLGAAVPWADVAFYFHRQVVDSRPSAQKCYQVLWKDSTNGTIQANYFAGTTADNYFYPGVLQWAAPPSPRAWLGGMGWEGGGRHWDPGPCAGARLQPCELREYAAPRPQSRGPYCLLQPPTAPPHVRGRSALCPAGPCRSLCSAGAARARPAPTAVQSPWLPLRLAACLML
jgi:hypothetical protein